MTNDEPISGKREHHGAKKHVREPPCAHGLASHVEVGPKSASE